MTRATLAGPLCEADRCTCRGPDGDVGTPDEGFKRFEIVLGPTQNQLWATVDDMVFYKSRERAKECFYIDLRPGAHRVTMQAEEEEHFGARLKISELGEKGAYDSFDFYCGAPGLCDLDSLRSWKADVARFSEGKHDPCGSTRVLGVSWETGRMPDSLHPAAMLLELTLKVYEFAPRHPPGDEACAR